MRQNINLDYYDPCYKDNLIENKQKKKTMLKRKRLKRKKKMKIRFKRFISLMILCIVVGEGIHIYKQYEDEKNLKVISNNVAELDELANADISSMQKELSKNKQKEADNSKPELGKSILNFSSSDYKTYFNDSVFWGDSISEGFIGYNILNDNEVVALKGKTVVLAQKDINTIVAKNPSKLYMLFGMNDLENYSDINDFKRAYEELLNSISSKLEDTDIYIMSTMYVNSKASSRQPSLSRDRVSKANGYLKEICRESKYKYIDITDIYDNNPSLYEQDGIHAVAKFYPILLNRLISVDLGENKVE